MEPTIPEGKLAELCDEAKTLLPVREGWWLCEACGLVHWFPLRDESPR